MFIKRIKHIIITALMLCMVFTIAGCEKSDTGDKIHGLEPVQYVNTIGNIVEAIYAPTSADDFRNVREVFSEYADESVINKFTSVSPDIKSENYSSRMRWITKAYGLGRYQFDGRTRAYYEFEVIRNYKHYTVCIELILDSEDKIVDYRVFN